MRTPIVVLGIALSAAGCGYTGPQGLFDYAMAASDGWVVQVVNFTACKQRPWDTADRGEASRVCVNTNILDCAGNPDHPPLGSYMGDPQVLRDASTGRFWWAAMNPARTGFCLSLASAADPFVMERQLYLPASSFAGSDTVDRDMLVVTANKIGISSYDEGTRLPYYPFTMGAARRITKVLNKEDFLAGRAVRTASITHDLDAALTISLGPIVGTGGAFTWVRPRAHALTIGIVTGVPGENGGINTATATIDRPWTWAFRPRDLNTPQLGVSVDARADGQGVLRYRADNGNGELWAVTPVQEDGRTQLRVDILNGISPTFNPAMVNSIPVRTGNSHMLCPSLAVGPGPQNRGLVGWTSISPTQWPKAEVLAINRNSGTQYLAVSGADPGSQYFGTLGPRLDYCPQGVVAQIGSEEWLGVGHNRLLAGAFGATATQFSAFFCAQVGGDLCTRPAR